MAKKPDLALLRMQRYRSRKSGGPIVKLPEGLYCTQKKTGGISLHSAGSGPKLIVNIVLDNGDIHEIARLDYSVNALADSVTVTLENPEELQFTSEEICAIIYGPDYEAEEDFSITIAELTVVIPEVGDVLPGTFEVRLPIGGPYTLRAGPRHGDDTITLNLGTDRGMITTLYD